MYYSILVVFLAVAASTVSQSCYKYCIIQLNNPGETSVAENCNCSSLDSLDTDHKKPSMSLTDTGVYFEPADESLFQEQFHARPFHISNPIKVVTKTKRSKVIESVSNKDFSYESTELLNEETIIQVHANEKKNIYPTYLDLEVEDVQTSNENVDKIDLLQDHKSMELSLEKCLDFHVLNYSRKHGILEKFKGYFDEKKLKLYDNVSDSDLTSLIRQYCRQSEFMIQESLREILRKVPGKLAKCNINNEQNVDSQRISTSTLDRNDNEALTKSISEIKVPRTDSSLVYAKTVEPTITYDKSIENLAGDINIIDIEYSTYSLKSSPTVDSVKGKEHEEEREKKTVTTSSREYSNDSLIDKNSDVTVFTESTLNICNSTDHTITTVLPEFFSETSNNSLIERVPDVSDYTTESTRQIYNSTNLTTVLREAYINNATMFDFETMPSEILYTTYKENNKNSSENGIHFEAITATSPLSKYSDNTLEQNVISSDDISTTTVSFTYSENQDTLNETDIIIPKTNSKELKNNTVQSSIDGYEILLNSDFNGDPEKIKEKDEVLAKSKSTFKKISEVNYISGNLYFSSNQELVPVRLLQSQGGNINVAINGDTLCDKLIKNTNNKSRLLSTLCECVRKNMGCT